MSHTLRPRAPHIREAIRCTKRSISISAPRRYPETETKTEEEEEADLPRDEAATSSTDLDANFLSTRPSIDSYLRVQNDAYLSKLKRNLESLSQTATSINTLLPQLAHRASLVRPPATSSSQIERAAIPPYTVSPWRKSADLIPPITSSLLSQIERVVKNIEDLQQEPYRSDVVPSEREKLNTQIEGWGKQEKEREFMNMELMKTGMEARFLRGVEGLEEGVKGMLRAREEREAMKEAARIKREGSAAGGSAVMEEKVTTTPSGVMNAGGTAVSYRPLVGGERTTANATAATAAKPSGGMEIPKTAGWGASATKVEERGKSQHFRTANPFKKTAAEKPSSTSNTKANLEALRKKLDENSTPTATETSTKPAASTTSRGDAEVEAKAPPQAAEAPAPAEEKPAKVSTLADLQRRMNALQGAKK